MGVAAVLLSSSLSMLESLKGLGFIGRLAYMLGLSLWVVICGPTTPIVRPMRPKRRRRCAAFGHANPFMAF